VDFSQWTTGLGWTLQETAELLHLAPRTLRGWQDAVSAAGWRLQRLGRPVLHSLGRDRRAVIAFIDELGPAVGVPMLEACFPAMPRAELAELLALYRRGWRRRHHQALHVLHWQLAGSVWAMDFAEAPQPIDGLYPYLLAVRDLASGRSLAWLPLTTATAAETIPALAPLFARYGAPLLLKTDNGSPFCAEATLDFLYRAGVLPLFSPPYLPRYNGAIEAGIGSLKSRSESHATRHERPGQWTWDDVEAARLEANATARPRGPRGPTPDALWAGRRHITQEERHSLQTSVDRQRTEVRARDGWPVAGPLAVQEARAVDRQAIRRALEQHGYLLYSRRRIPLPITKHKVANIT
jgi:transposase InsO family protein